MTLPKITIVTPSYNQGNFIEETILSVINQNYPNIEYMIIDGGSTDNSVEIIKKYEKHLAYWVSEKDSGQSEAINKGFKRATGDIVCWINSDDILMRNTLNQVVEYFEANKEANFLNGNTVIIDVNSNIITANYTLKQKKWYARFGIYYLNQPAMFWKRDLFETIGLLKNDYHAAMDREFLLRIFESDYDIGQTAKLLAGFRKHSKAKSSGNIPECVIRDKAEMYKLYAGRYKQDPDFIVRLIYGLEKLIKGIYLKKWIFTARWKGKTLTKLQLTQIEL